MACNVEDKKRLIEAAEYKLNQLKKLQEDGYEEYYNEGEDIDSIETEINNMQAIIDGNMKKVLEEEQEQVKNAEVAGRKYYRIYRKTRNHESFIDAFKTTINAAGNYIVDYTTQKLRKDKTITIPANGKMKNGTQYNIHNLDYALGNSADIADKKLTTQELNKYEKMENDIHGNTENMIKLLDVLNAKSGIKTTDEHLNILKDLFKKMNPKFFKKMNLYIRENTTENYGIIDATNIALGISKKESLDKNRQSAAEVYAHEIVHAYTMFAIKAAKAGDVEARRILVRLEYVMQEAKKNTTWEHMLGDIKKEDATASQIKDAKDMYQYIFIDAHAEEEFIAHVLTNPIVSKHMQTLTLKEKKERGSIFQIIKNMFDYLSGILIGDYKFNSKNKNLHKATEELAFLFAYYNNKAVVNAERKENGIQKLTDAFNKLDTEASFALKKFAEMVLPKVEFKKMPKDKLGQAKFIAEVFAKSIIDPAHRKALMLLLDRIGAINASGSIASIIRDMTEQDDTSQAIDWLQVQADKIDQLKMNMAAVVTDNVTKAYAKTLTEEEETALTNVLLDTDMQSISSKFTKEKLIEILEDKNKLMKSIHKVREDLKKMDQKHYGWNVNQAMGLGYYLATGKAHYGQMLNAFNIARGVGSAELYKTNSKIIDKIDTLATLEALLHVKNADKKIVVELMKTEWEGIDTTLKTAKALHKESMETILKGQESFAIKGYSKELFDEQINIEVAPVDAEKEMKAKGFKKIQDLKQHTLVNTKTKYALYASNSFQTRQWNRAAVRLTKNHTRGTSLKDIWYAEDTMYTHKKYNINKLQIDNKRFEMVKAMNDRVFDVKDVEYGLSPVIDMHGNVMGYRYMMEKEVKEKLLKQNKKITEILGSTKATLIDKQHSKTHDEKVLNFIKEDVKENYVQGRDVGKNGIPYILISPDSDNVEIQEIWNIMPEEFKAEALRSKEKGLPIRKDMLHNYFGYRDLTIVETPWLKDHMPQMLKNAILIAETLWKEFIKIVKIDILIKMPFVLVGNIMSNMVYAINTGSTPIEVLKLYTDSTRDVRHYLAKHRELVRLQELVQIKKATKTDEEQILILQKQLKASPIHELYELGVYQAIVEDVNKEELSSKNKIKQMYKKKTEKAPKIIKNGLNWLFLTEETGYYKFATEVLQMSDLIARDVENRKMKIKIERQMNGKESLPLWYVEHLEKADKGYGLFLGTLHKNESPNRKMDAKEKAYFKKIATSYKNSQILNNFVNYNKVSGPMEEYLNKIGFIMFTKYAKRIQKVITQTGVTHPLKSLGILLFDSFIWNMDTIHDQQLFLKSWYNMTPQYPWERIMDVMTPALVQSTTYKFL